MAAVLVLPAQLLVGDSLSVDGTGFQNSHAYTAKIVFPEGPTVTAKGTTSAGAFTGDLTAILSHEGTVTVTVDDGTDTVTGTVSVWNEG